MTARGSSVGQPPGGPVVTRFAPSPTGRLHLGHAYSAIAAHDLARAGGGRFLVRIEDIDAGRSRAEHVAAIAADLAWLGLGWDGWSVQSERLGLYAAALERLRAMAVVYPCFCTRAEIAAAMGAPHPGEGEVYPGTCRGMGVPDLTRQHAWRLDVEKALLVLSERGQAELGDDFTWHDATAGWVAADPRSLGDVVLARKDVATSYHLAVTADDAAQGVTDIVRGVDLFAATHVHRLLQALLGLPTPRYHHHPLLVGPDGGRLAKRHGSPSLEAIRADGIDGRHLAARLRAGDVGFGPRST